jgi:hypothetical protein
LVGGSIPSAGTGCFKPRTSRNGALQICAFVNPGQNKILGRRGEFLFVVESIEGSERGDGAIDKERSNLHPKEGKTNGLE